MPEALDDQLLARQIQVLADGACDAMALVFFEMARGDRKSEEWMARQYRKINGVLNAMDDSRCHFSIPSHQQSNIFNTH